MKQLTYDDFEDAINSSERVIIEFSAEWCGPCRILKPILEEISKETDINVYNVDVDNEVELCTKFGIRNIPATLYYKNGELISKTIGTNPKQKILEQFNK